MRALTLALLAAGCSSSVSPGARPASDAATPTSAVAGSLSFVIEAKVSYPEPWANGDFSDGVFPAAHRFTATLLPSAGGQQQLVVGGGGRTAEVTLDRQADGSFLFRDSDPMRLDQRRTALEMALVPARVMTCTSVYSASYQELRLSVVGDSITGAGTGFFAYEHSDYVGSRPFAATLRGARDRSGPEVSNRPFANPFDNVWFEADEAVAGAVELASGPQHFPLTASPTKYPSWFLLDPPRLLPFGASWMLQGVLPDLAGNPNSSTSLNTPPAPPPFAGATTPLAGLLVGRVRVEPIGGKPTILIPSGPPEAGGGRFTARLPVPPGAGTLVLVARLAGSESITNVVALQVATPGGLIDRWEVILPDLTGALASGLAEYPRLGASATLRRPLADSGPEIYVDIDNIDLPCGGPAAPRGAVLIESLTVE